VSNSSRAARFTGVDGHTQTTTAGKSESSKMILWWEAGFRAGDVEADYTKITVLEGEQRQSLAVMDVTEGVDYQPPLEAGLVLAQPHPGGNGLDHLGRLHALLEMKQW
jgi:hypothetical protein